MLREDLRLRARATLPKRNVTPLENLQLSLANVKISGVRGNQGARTCSLQQSRSGRLSRRPSRSITSLTRGRSDRLGRRSSRSITSLQQGRSGRLSRRSSRSITSLQQGRSENSSRSSTQRILLTTPLQLQFPETCAICCAHAYLASVRLSSRELSHAHFGNSRYFPPATTTDSQSMIVSPTDGS